ncbi:MoaD/ThiS family protein [Ammoniphilus sp. 3BR4]|uniref:MoaD/ThiS family protein n=1 Tax=Ammoniphilus sp. 3BR4 TaxID=3158265 RepID=UPI0034650FB9
MKVKVVSNIIGKTELTGEYELAGPQRISAFMETLGVAWDHEALVVVNNHIINEDYLVQDQDEIHLLIPIFGG